MRAGAGCRRAYPRGGTGASGGHGRDLGMSEQGTGEAAGGPGPKGREKLHHAKEIAAEEFRRYLIAAAYLYVILGLFTVSEEMTLRTHGGLSQAIPFAPHGIALINALVLGKVALVVGQLKLGVRWKPEPLIYPIV